MSGQRDEDDFGADLKEIGEIFLFQHALLVHTPGEIRKGTMKGLAGTLPLVLRSKAESFQQLEWHQQLIGKFISFGLTDYVVDAHLLEDDRYQSQAPAV